MAGTTVYRVHSLLELVSRVRYYNIHNFTFLFVMSHMA